MTGDTAVGKMTVGQELMKITPLRLETSNISAPEAARIIKDHFNL